MRVLFSQGIIAISKPRCGSTSVRRILDGLMKVDQGDIAVDVAGKRPPYHPHLSAPYLKKLLVADGHNIDGMTTIIFTRNPVDMLWSYFNFFKPDTFGRYDYNGDWDSTNLYSFEDWIMRGRVGMNHAALAMAPDWIKTTNLTPLSLEAHTDNRDGTREVDMIFRVEEIGKFLEWLAKKTGRVMAPRHVNGSGAGKVPVLSSEALDRVRQMFPLECEMYGV